MMAAKWLIVMVALVATASAQTSMMPEASPTPMPTTEPPTMGATTQEAPMVVDPMTDAVALPNDTIEDRFVSSQANETRGNHFYCLGINNTRTNFRNFTYRWGLWIQYPVLSYLDTMRKRHLFYVISRMAGISNFEDICVAEVEHYGVSTYRESVFVKLYINGEDNMDRLRTYDTNFRNSYSASNMYTEMFLDRLAVNVNSTEPPVDGPVLSSRTVNDSVHPGCDMVQCPEGDPTVLAIVLGTYVGPWYIVRYENQREDLTVEDLMSGMVPSFTRLESFAENPRPINYGLEAGDIVFAVFGSVFLTILCGAIILGFFIHPFFLS